MRTISTDIQIRFADVDILGHVNNVNLQHYFDIGKRDFYQQILGTDVIKDDFGLIMVATNSSYMAQTRLNDNVYTQTQLEKMGTKSITLFQRLINKADGEVRAESHTVLVTYDFKTQQSVEIPNWLRQAME